MTHVPVLLREALDYFQVLAGGTYLDATLGAGGHTEAILERLGSGRLLAIDCDPAAIQLAGQRLARLTSLAGDPQRLQVHEGNFADVEAIHAASGLPLLNGALADLGVSSMQLEDAERGFSFSRSGPLDMRMSPREEITAAEIVNQMPEHDLADLIYRFGEERHSRRIARAIMKARPFRDTTDLAQVVRRANPSRTGLHQIDAATRTFMALRLAVNKEMESLEAFLAHLPAVMRPGGRVVIISFHSLEDRIVKTTFRSWKQAGRARLLTPKVVTASEEEVRANPRSRSAKLRAVEMSPGGQEAPAKD